MRVAAPSPPGATSVSKAAGVPTAKPAAPAPPLASAKAPVYEAKPAAPAPPPASAKVPVHEWSLKDKFAEALKRTAPKLPGEMRHQFEALLTPASLIMAGTLAVWAGAQFFGVGEIADIVLLLAGVYFLGSAIFAVAEDFYDFVSITVGAESEADLDSAAAHLARVIAVIGVTAFLALLFKLRMKKGGGRRQGTHAVRIRPAENGEAGCGRQVERRTASYQGSTVSRGPANCQRSRLVKTQR